MALLAAGEEHGHGMESASKCRQRFGDDLAVPVFPPIGDDEIYMPATVSQLRVHELVDREHGGMADHEQST